MSASTYHHLIEYHQECGLAASAVTENRDVVWLQQGTAGLGCFTRKCDKRRTVSVYDKDNFVSESQTCRWWSEYIDKVHEAVKKRPCGATVTDTNLICRALSEAMLCEGCQKQVFEPTHYYLDDKLSFVEFAQYLAELVDDAAAKVNLSHISR